MCRELSFCRPHIVALKKDIQIWLDSHIHLQIITENRSEQSLKHASTFLFLTSLLPPHDTFLSALSPVMRFSRALAFILLALLSSSKTRDYSSSKNLRRVCISTSSQFFFWFQYLTKTSYALIRPHFYPRMHSTSHEPRPTGWIESSNTKEARS